MHSLQYLYAAILQSEVVPILFVEERSMSFRTVIGVAFALLAFADHGGNARAEPLKILIDADFSMERNAAEAIELGIRTALSEVRSEIGGKRVVVERHDHRGNSKRSRLTLKRFLKDDNTLAIFGGLHSPPYLTYRDFINTNDVLMLLPWSAAGPITRAAEDERNWIFRLSVDDRKAGPFLIAQAQRSGCERIGLALVDTGWGRANRVSMSKALEKLGRAPSRIVMFADQLGESGARDLAEQMTVARADCLILLSTAATGAKISKALDHANVNIRIFSHWGVLGGDFPKLVPHEMRQRLQLQVLQTCGLLREKAGSPVLRKALDNAMVSQLAEISAPAGFTHGYDLTRLLIAAAEQAKRAPGWSSSIVEKRRALKQALEALEQPVPGILDIYKKPFEPYALSRPDAHEALGAEHLCMTVFQSDGRLADAHNTTTR